MISSVKVYRNGDIGIIFNQKCPTCKKKHWIFSGYGEDDVIMECLECGESTKIDIKIKDMAFQRQADEIIKQISNFKIKL